jgi:hypothetical protein
LNLPSLSLNNPQQGEIMMKMDNKHQAVKREWKRPQLQRLEAGAAESTHNANSDGGGGNQGS